jgi:PII-like signaling protein
MEEAGTLQHLRPGETRDVDVTIEVLDSAEEIESIKNKIKAMRENA